MSSGLYLEHYLDSLETLPGELRRNFTLMHDLDVKNRAILREVDSSSDEYLRKVRELTPEQRRAEMDKIQAMFHRAKEHGDDKVAIAIQTYELVDKHIRRLDADLARFEAEMKEKGRLSQTETEDEPDDEEPAKKKGKKLKDGPGRKKKGGAPQKAEAEVMKNKKKKKSLSSATPSTKASSGAAADMAGVPPLVALPPGMLPVPQEVLDMPVDPNEPTYCLCQQVSYGEMIGCDNGECPIEWFHFGCMGLTSKPKGKWYCPKCLPQFKKKK
jgi:inhibitor of growth protein 4